MSNLLNNFQKLDYQSAFNDIHDTFSRTVKVWKDSERIVITEVDNNFNPFYRTNAQPSVESEYEEEVAEFPMRIKWLDPRQDVSLPGGYQIRDSINDNICRLKMEEDAFNFIDGCKKIEVDGRDCERVGFSRPHGIVDNQFFTIFVKEVV